jgi:hypothetical protein
MEESGEMVQILLTGATGYIGGACYLIHSSLNLLVPFRPPFLSPRLRAPPLSAT